MTDNPISDSELHLRLTAYLDGELGDEDHHDVEQKLLSDPQYRKAMQNMQKTWDLLDHLPSSRVNNSFTQSTMELVISETEKELNERAFSPWTWPLRFGSLLVVTLLSLGVSFGVTRWIKDRPNQSLRANVHVIENLKHLEYGDSIEFLELLAKRDFFNDEVEDLPEFDRLSQRWTDDWGADSKAAAESHGTLKKYLDSASEDLVYRLKKNRERFDLLTAEQKWDLSQLYSQIQKHENRDQLLETLELYERWLQRLQTQDNSAYKNILNQSTPQQRVSRIASIRSAMPFAKSSLPEEDVPMFRSWLVQRLYANYDEKDGDGELQRKPLSFGYMRAYEKGLIAYQVANAEVDDAELSDEQVYKKYGQMLIALGKAVASGKSQLKLNDIYGAQLSQLKSGLSAEGVDAIEEGIDDSDKQVTDAEVEFVFGWIKAALEAEFQPMAIQLKEFYNEELTESERAELDRFPPEEHKQELRRMFERRANINNRPGR